MCRIPADVSEIGLSSQLCNVKVLRTWRNDWKGWKMEGKSQFQSQRCWHVKERAGLPRVTRNHELSRRWPCLGCLAQNYPPTSFLIAPKWYKAVVWIFFRAICHFLNRRVCCCRPCGTRTTSIRRAKRWVLKTLLSDGNFTGWTLAWKRSDGRKLLTRPRITFSFSYSRCLNLICRCWTYFTNPGVFQVWCQSLITPREWSSINTTKSTQ